MRLAFRAVQFAARCGVHVLPTHYSSPLPNIPDLEKTVATWARRSTMPNIRWNTREQATMLRTICMPFREEYTAEAFAGDFAGRRLGPGFGPIEAQALHAFIRWAKPDRIIEVGGGESTFVMRRAAERNAAGGAGTAALTTVDPHPSNALRELTGVRLIASPVQVLPPEFFASLLPGDVLCIDSSHAVKPGSDVNYLILEILPRLTGGVFVHFHDIFFPYDYQRNTLQTFYHWSESSLLRAYLADNHRMRILFSMSGLHYDAPEFLREVFPDYRRRDDRNGLELPAFRPFDPLPGHFPASLFLQTL